MPTKGSRRRTAGDVDNTSNPALPPDRANWPGWIELESEPVRIESCILAAPPGTDGFTKAFFNVMLREMGADGVKVQEVLGLDDDMLAILPYASMLHRPVHI